MSPCGPSSLASLNGEIMPVDEALIPVTDQGLVRGDGVFEVMRVYAGRLYALEEHMARLERSAANIRLPVDAELIRAEAARLVARAGPGPDHDLVRIMVTRGGRRVMFTEMLPDHPPELRLRSITYAPTRILDGIKSLSYAANMLATRLAQEEGFDEALLVTPHGRVLEGPTSSIFWIRGGELFTPPLSEHILASITRALVIDVAGAQERPVTLDELREADEVFLASTTREVEPVGAIDDHAFPGPRPVSDGIRERVSERIRVQLASA
jgi:branched-chain amino acid aminotransferase